MVIKTSPACKPLTQEELTQLRHDVEALTPDQRTGIEAVVPECITVNAEGVKNIELHRLRSHPELGSKLLAYVKAQTKKNQQREQRKRKDRIRREQRARIKAEENKKKAEIAAHVAGAGPSQFGNTGMQLAAGGKPALSGM